MELSQEQIEGGQCSQSDVQTGEHILSSCSVVTFMLIFVPTAFNCLSSLSFPVDRSVAVVSFHLEQ